MADQARVKIIIKLEEDWVGAWQKKSMPPIDLVIGTLVFESNAVKVLQRDRLSCTLSAAGEEGTVRKQIARVLKNKLSWEQGEPGVMVQFIPMTDAEQKKPRIPARRMEQTAQEHAPRWRVTLRLQDEWVAQRRRDDTAPVEQFIQSMKAAFDDCAVEKKGLLSCTLAVASQERADVKSCADETLRGMQAIDAVEELSVQDASLAQEKTQIDAPQQNAAQEVKRKSKDEGEHKGAPAAVAKIENLIGVESLKDLARELVDVAPQILRHKTQDAFARRSYLFMIGEGCGLSTWLKLLAELIDGLELFHFTSGRRVVEVAPDKKLEDMLSEANGHGMSKRLICFDIREWMDKVRTPQFRNFLHELYALTDEQIFVFRIPYVDEETRANVADALRDVLTIREVAVAPYTTAHFRQYAERLLAERAFSMDEEVWQRFEERIVAEKNDGHFYGLTTVKKIVDEFIYYKHIAAARGFSTTPDEKRIVSGDVPDRDTARRDGRSAMQQLDALVGVEPIKKRLLEVLAQIEVSQQTDMALHPSIHMRFVGNPGTGKTTVARILGQLMKERGLLSKGQFFEYAGRDFCGQYIGETAPKTAAMCRDAYGSVLFIDEAYALYRSGDDSRDYGREAIDTLIAQMENHRQDFMVIMAGYRADMEKLMSANAGLASRMPYTIDFPNYTREELAQIFMSMARGSFEWEAQLEDAVGGYFEGLSDALLEADDFANARFVRNLFERTWGKASLRRSLDPDAPIILRAVDFEKAVADGEFQSMQKRTVNRIGF